MVTRQAAVGSFFGGSPGSGFTQVERPELLLLQVCRQTVGVRKLGEPFERQLVCHHGSGKEPPPSISGNQPPADGLLVGGLSKQFYCRHGLVSRIIARSPYSFRSAMGHLRSTSSRRVPTPVITTLRFGQEIALPDHV